METVVRQMWPYSVELRTTPQTPSLYDSYADAIRLNVEFITADSIAVQQAAQNWQPISYSVQQTASRNRMQRALDHGIISRSEIEAAFGRDGQFTMPPQGLLRQVDA